MNSNVPSSSSFRSAIGAALLALASVLTAHAVPILGGQIYSNGGDVTVTFLGSDAGYDNLLYLSINPSGLIFEGHATPVNTVADLGMISAGTELIFLLNNQQGNVWSTGPGSRNSDGLGHALVDSNYGPNFVWVGFEDLPGGGDKDYNDLIFGVSNPPPSRGHNPVPDASATLPLVGAALVGLAGLARRRKN